MADEPEVVVDAPVIEGESPEVQVPATEAPAAAAPAAPEQGKEQAGDDTPEPRGKKRWQKRVDKLTHRVREMESALLQATEALAARTPQIDPDEPKVEAFSTYEDYLKAVVKHQLKVNSAPEAPVQRVQPVELADDAEESFEVASERYKDFDAVVRNPNIVLRREWGDALADSPVMADVLYHLAKNQAEAKALDRMSPAARVRELGRLESKVQAQFRASASKPAPQPSGAPAPISPVKPVATVQKDLSDPNLSDADFDRLLREKRRKR